MGAPLPAAAACPGRSGGGAVPIGGNRSPTRPAQEELRNGSGAFSIVPRTARAGAAPGPSRSCPGPPAPGRPTAYRVSASGVRGSCWVVAVGERASTWRTKAPVCRSMRWGRPDFIHRDFHAGSVDTMISSNSAGL